MMSTALVLSLIFVLSFAPAALAFVWLRRRLPAFTLTALLIFVGAGVLSLALAAVAQSLMPEFGGGALERALSVLVRVALIEETSRLALITLALFFRRPPREAGFAAAGGLIAGLVFAALETAVYAANSSGIVLLRAFTAAPLHGACGIRCGLAAFALKKTPLAAGGRFCSAVALHAFYNLMLERPGIAPALAAVLAVTSLLSSLRAVRPAETTASF